jgi:pimeloyl-ACP methyl ester carboxylesterase
MIVLGAFVAALAVTVLALSLVILALTNLPFVADFARSTQRTFASGVGDAYVLTRSPVRFGAMASQVRADLEDLSRQSRVVAVIAHSQGTAVAWHAIKHGLTDDPSTNSAVAQHLRLFLTYGQAVRKLTFMNLVAEGSETRNGTLPLVGAVSGLLALAEFFVVGPGFLMQITVAFAIAAEARLMARVMTVWKPSQVKIERDWDRVHAAAPGLEWLDLWASAEEISADVSIAVIQLQPSASTRQDHLAARTLAEVITAVEGSVPRFEVCAGVLETRWYAQLGIPAFGYGPGRFDVSHGPDEYVDESATCRCAVVYALVCGCAVGLMAAPGGIGLSRKTHA